MKENKETRDGKLIYREVDFHKWGREWIITVYMHAPVTSATRDVVEKVLASFRFDGVPTGDELWALSVARKKLPAEADPEEYTRQGGSSAYYCSAKVKGDEVMVTFTKHVGKLSAKSWNYVVSANGEVSPVEPGK